MALDTGSERDWTVLLIGGASASGKSTLGALLGVHFGVRILEGDLFWLSLLETQASEVHFFDSENVWDLPTRELVEAYLKSSQYVCRSLEIVIAHCLATKTPSILEASFLLPSLATRHEYAKRVVKANEVRAIFLYEPEKAQIRLRSRDRNRHPERRRDDWQPRVEMHYTYGLEIKHQAEALGLPVLESRPLETLLDRALAALEA